MSDQAASTGYLTGACWGNGKLPFPHTCRGHHTHCSSRSRQPRPIHQMRQEYSRGGTSTSRNGTLVHAYEDYWASPSGHLRMTDTPRDAAHNHTTAKTFGKSDRNFQSEPKDNQKFLEWAGPSQYEQTEQPPRTPQIRRLKTPELEPLHYSGRFCDCASCGEVRYQKGRAKMDSQRECMPSLSFSLTGRGDIEVL